MVNVTPPPQLVVQPYQPQRMKHFVVLAVLLWIVSFLIGIWFVRQSVSHGEAGQDNHEHAALLEAQTELEAQRQKISVLERSGQVSNVAATDLQQTLRERQEEIAGLRADLAFYSRLTGGNGKREGLAVHSVHLQPVEGSRAYNFTVTLTQNLKKTQMISGRIRISVEGVRDQQLTTLAWPELGQGQDTKGIEFSFKYFQRLPGTLMLPEGFAANRIKVSVDANGEGNGLEQDFAWNEALASEEANDVQP